ncbi:MAG: DUF1926 domain-containing protein [Thermodesulfobacteriota bacterium]|nr:MAG: DUF1926 domain-containing protein [Thermodesulfobacteriota bacterium]
MTYFVFCIHNHQPVGNFDSVMEEAYRDSYWPFLEALSRHPAIKLSLHNTGFLLDWIAEKHPEYIELLRSMAATGQVEIMGGGYYEPVLSVIPEEDRVRQVTMLSERIEELFRVRPRGIWLAERVWEPTHPSIIKKAGLEYLVVDDYHFVKAGLEKDELGGYYTTEDQGDLIKIFPGNEALRYLIPFKPVEGFEEYMLGIRNGFFRRGNAAIYGDDGEKFGVWPGTRKWVFDDGWLERFFESIERNLDWIKPSTLGGYLDHEEPVGHTYLPNTSYMEMGEWALPAGASRDYMRLIEELGRLGETGGRLRRFLQGGTWRNFLAKYPESNWMHKRMLMVSRELKKGASGNGGRDEAERHLYRAQCNDAYWHGVFGGLYLPHLRTAVYENLILAEGAALEKSGKGVEISASDLDADNHEEVVVRSSDLSVFLSPFNGGALFELDYRPKGVNIQNTLTRYQEGYHYKLEESGGGDENNGAKSIHEMVKVKEEGLLDYLKYDRNRRASFIDHFLDAGLTLDEFYSHTYRELGDFAWRKYEKGLFPDKVVMQRSADVLGSPYTVKKTLSIDGGNALIMAYEVSGGADREKSGLFGVELNLILPGCDGPACWYESNADLGSGGIGLGSRGRAEGVEWLRLVDSWKGIAASIGIDRPAALLRYPVHTVSLSEGGFEKIYQGSCLLFLFPAGSRPLRLSFRLAVEGLSK